IGDPRAIYARPANAFVASFIGVANLLRGSLLARAGGLCCVEVPLGNGREPLRLQAAGGEGAAKGQPLILSIRPEDIALHVERPTGIADGNVFDGEVIDTIYLGNFLECRVRVGALEV